MANLQKQSIRLLLVDDDEEGAYYLAQALRMTFDFDVVCAGSGNEALDIVSGEWQHFDVALVDQNLDVAMNGIELMKQLFLLDPLLPVILFTGLELQPDHLRAIEDGAYLYLHMRKGETPLEQLGIHCLAAARDRERPWLTFLQEIGRALQTLQVDQILETSATWLNKLGYTRGAIYRHVRGWVIDDIANSDGIRPIKSCRYLRAEQIFSGSDFPASIDLGKHIDIQELLDSGNSVTVHETADHQQIRIPLRGKEKLDTTGTDPLGLLIVEHASLNRLEHLESRRLATLGQLISLALQNALAYQQLDYRRDSAKQILKTNYRILALESYGNDADILDEFANSISTALHLERVIISIIDEGEDCVEARGLAGIDPSMRGRRTKRTDFEVLHQPEFRLSPHCFFIPEGSYDLAQYRGVVLRDSQYDAQPWEWHAGDMIRAEVIDSREKVLGYITADRRKNKRRPDENLLGAIEVFASQIVIAIENLNYQRTIEVIQQIGIQISRTRSRNTLFQKVHAQLKHLMPIDVLMIGRYDRERNQVRVLYRKKIIPSERNLPIVRSADHGLSGYIVRNDKPLLFNNEDDIRAFHQENAILPIGKHARSWMGVPLKIDGRVIGVLALKDNRRDNLYTRRDLRLLMILADQIAVAVRRIELEEEQLSAELRTITEIGQDVGTALHPQRVEHRILEWACRHTAADYGIILHYDVGDHSLVFSESYINNPNLCFTTEVAPGLRLPLNPPPGTPASLSVEVARTPRPQRWSDVRLEPNYLETVKTTLSQMSLPLFVSMEGAEKQLLGVLTLESHRLNNFGRLRRDFMVAVANLAAQASLRAKEKDRSSALLFWRSQDLSSEMVRHRYVTGARSLVNQLTLIASRFRPLIENVEMLHSHAIQIQPDAEIHLEERHLISLNDVVRDFFNVYSAFYHEPRIELTPQLNLSDDQLVEANELGLHEALKILVENAIKVLNHEPYGGQILIGTSRDDTSTILRVLNSGPMLHPRDVALLTDTLDSHETSDQGLVQVRLLAELYGATLILAQNNDGDVEFNIRFTPSASSPILLNRDISREILRIKRNIASHSALRFTQRVKEQSAPLHKEFEQLFADIETARQSVDVLTTYVDARLDTVELIVVDDLLREIVRELYDSTQPSDQPDISIDYDVQIEGTVYIKANRSGISEVLHILVDNARRAIREQQRNSDGQPRITIRAEVETTRVKIHIHNTGSYIIPVIANQLFEERIPDTSGRGLGLLLSRGLITSYGGSLHLTLNDQQRGVQFTIELRREDKTV